MIRADKGCVFRVEADVTVLCCLYALEAVFGHDDVVEYFNAHQLSSLLELLGYLPVLQRHFEASAWMVVG